MLRPGQEDVNGVDVNPFTPAIGAHHAHAVRLLRLHGRRVLHVGQVEGLASLHVVGAEHGDIQVWNIRQSKSCNWSANSKHWFYDILPSTTAVFSYAIGSRKLSANEQFFVGAQAVVKLSLLQTTQIKQGVSFMAANKVYTSTNKTTIV